MAGRGVDIKLGEGVVELGGLYVLGTERHEARRIDNQLRGRSGRQGDPGETRFYLSAQDDLVRLFAGDRIYRIIERFKIPEDQPMEAKILSQQIENAQKKVEEQNFVSRKNVLKYDDVMNKQRVVIYEQRRKVLEGEDFSEELKSWIAEVVERAVDLFVDPESGDIDLDTLTQAMQAIYGTEITAAELREDGITERQRADRGVHRGRAGGVQGEGGGARHRADARARAIHRSSRSSTRAGASHLDDMDYLREGVHLRAMAQKDPLVEYTSEGHGMFGELNAQIREEVLTLLFHAQLQPDEAEELQRAQQASAVGNGGLSYEHETRGGRGGDRRRARRRGDRGEHAPAAAAARRRRRTRRSAGTSSARAARARSSRSATEPDSALTRHSPTRRSGSSRSTSATSPASSGCSRIPT